MRNSPASFLFASIAAAFVPSAGLAQDCRALQLQLSMHQAAREGAQYQRVYRKMANSGCLSGLSSRAPGPTATTSPSCDFSFAVSGIMMPPCTARLT
jgi:hypothetical protein